MASVLRTALHVGVQYRLPSVLQYNAFDTVGSLVQGVARKYVTQLMLQTLLSVIPGKALLSNMLDDLQEGDVIGVGKNVIGEVGQTLSHTAAALKMGLNAAGGLKDQVSKK